MLLLFCCTFPGGPWSKHSGHLFCLHVSFTPISIQCSVCVCSPPIAAKDKHIQIHNNMIVAKKGAWWRPDIALLRIGIHI